MASENVESIHICQGRDELTRTNVFVPYLLILDRLQASFGRRVLMGSRGQEWQLELVVLRAA